MEGKIKLGDEEYSFVEIRMPQASLKFYLENPRVYSYFDRSERDPTQEEIESVLCDMDSVKELKSAIESTGGLVHPLVVVDGKNEVIEGNRRLAAYRILAKKDPMKWSHVRCMILPSSLSEKAIFILLGQYHLHGQLAWAPFELAGYLYRRIVGTGVKPESIAKEVSKTPSEIKQYFKVYEFMLDQGDLDARNWSFYEEYLKSRSIKKMRDNHPELDSAVSSGVKSGAIRDARIDIRDKLGTVSKLPTDVRDKMIKSYVKGEKSLNEIYGEAQSIGIDIYQDIRRFRMWIANPDTTSVIRNLSREDRSKYIFELDQISKKANKLIQILEKDE